MKQQEQKQELPPGLYITYESIGAILMAACIMVGAAVILVEITEGFYKAKQWVGDHYIGFIFANLMFTATGLIAYLIHTIRIKRLKQKKYEEFL